MSIREIVIVLAFNGFVLPCSASPGRHFRGLGVVEQTEHTVTVEDIEANLRASFDAVLGGGDDPVSQRLANIEASLWQTYQSLPKNDAGRLAPRGVRHIVHNYFAKEHGWVINGLEPDAMQMNVSELHELDILEDKAPAFVEGLLEARRSGHGLSLNDVVVMVGALERLIFYESISLLQAAYAFNEQHVSGQIDEGTLHDVLTSYLLVFEMGTKGNTSDAQKHQKIKAKMAAGGTTWPMMVSFARNAVKKFNTANARDVSYEGTGSTYSFKDSSRIVEDLAQGYGKWQDTECRQMKAHLMKLDKDGLGRVTLDAFYSQLDSVEYQFTESLQYLRQIGALDEPVGGTPKVRIANYVAGPSNCIASSRYYSVCCLSECDVLRSRLERQIQAPFGSPAALLGAVGNLSSSSVVAPRDLPLQLQAKLHTIAERHGDGVPMHGRLFTQWMHYAFPNECPYPHVVEEGDALFTPSEWAKEKHMASTEEKEFHVNAASERATLEESSEPDFSLWTDEEVLHLHGQPRRETGVRKLISGTVRAVMQVAMLCVVLKVAWALWAQGSDGIADKKTRVVLPMHAKHI